MSPPHRPLLVRGSLSSSQEHQPYLRSPQFAAPKSRPVRARSQGWQKNRETFAQTRGLIRETPNFFPESRHFFLERATFSRIARLLLWNGTTSLQHSTIFLLHRSISFAFPRLTLRSPSNAQVPPSHRSPTTSSSLCLPSVNSLSTTTAAP